MAVSWIREGFRSITPYVFAAGADRLIDFLKQAFDAEEIVRKDRPDGAVMHAELRVGDSMLMVGEGGGEFGPMPCSIYLYVPDCDRTFRQALQAGGVSVFDVMTLPSGERYGGIKDPCGNIWWVATHVEDLTPEEQERRWKNFQR